MLNTMLTFDTWASFAEALQPAISREKVFILQAHSNIGEKNPFLQGYHEHSGLITIECSPPRGDNLGFSNQVRLKLLELGWSPPDFNLPNYMIFLERANSDSKYVTYKFIETLTEGYGLNLYSSRFAFY